MRYLWIIAFSVGFLSFGESEQAENAYILKYKELAISEMARSGIPASIKLAQAIVESNSGRSLLASRANNHFGIKCKSWWEGACYYYTDDDRDQRGNLIPSCFRRYSSPFESYTDHTSFLQSSERYASLFSFLPADYRGWAEGLSKCGYATDPDYARKLIHTIEKYRLHQFDVMPANKQNVHFSDGAEASG